MFKNINDLVIDKEHFMVISPDEGAMNRNLFLRLRSEVSLGMFYKRRDYSRVVNGRNPIVAHEYLGDSVADMTYLLLMILYPQVNQCLI